jgi:hypothetical protein
MNKTCGYEGCTKQADYEIQKGDKPSDTTYACEEHVEEIIDETRLRMRSKEERHI